MTLSTKVGSKKATTKKSATRSAAKEVAETIPKGSHVEEKKVSTKKKSSTKKKASTKKSQDVSQNDPVEPIEIETDQDIEGDGDVKKPDKHRRYHLLPETIQPPVDEELLPNNKGNYKGKPMQAGKKAFATITRRCAPDQDRSEFIFSIQEDTPGSKMSRFTYRGVRTKRDTPHEITKDGKLYYVRFNIEFSSYKPSAQPLTKKSRATKKKTTKKSTKNKSTKKPSEEEEAHEEKEGEKTNEEEDNSIEGGSDEQEEEESTAEVQKKSGRGSKRGRPDKEEVEESGDAEEGGDGEN